MSAFAPGVGASTRLPPSIVWGTLAICVLPSLLNLAGVDFGSGSASRETPAPGDPAYTALRGAMIHTLLEWSGFCAALFTGALALLRFRMVRDVATPVIGMALVLSGCMDAFHILAADRLVSAQADNRLFIPFTWAISRLFNSLILLVGVVIFLVRKEESNGGRRRFVVVSALAFGAVALGLIYYCTQSQSLPRTMYEDPFLRRPFDVVPLGVFLLLLGFLIPRFERRNPGVFAHALLLSTVPNIVTQFHAAFGSTELYDNHFNVAHFLKVVAYLVPLGGLAFDYVQILVREREGALALLAANRALAEKNRELDEFAHVASHDLQEPLRKITAFAELLEEDAGDSLPDRAREDLHFVRDGARHLRDVVGDLLDYSRAGSGPFEPRDVDLATCLEGSLKSLGMHVRDSRATIAHDPLPHVRGDEVLITRLFQNLIANALKFSRERPRIRVTVDPGESGPVFGVRDWGIGIRPDYQDKIFEPFRRLHSRSEFPGTGVGLAICRRVVERHGGRIWVEAAPGGGSHFKFTLAKTGEPRPAATA